MTKKQKEIRQRIVQAMRLTLNDETILMVIAEGFIGHLSRLQGVVSSKAPDAREKVRIHSSFDNFVSLHDSRLRGEDTLPGGQSSTQLMRYYLLSKDYIRKLILATQLLGLYERGPHYLDEEIVAYGFAEFVNAKNRLDRYLCNIRNQGLPERITSQAFEKVNTLVTNFFNLFYEFSEYARKNGKAMAKATAPSKRAEDIRIGLRKEKPNER